MLCAHGPVVPRRGAAAGHVAEDFDSVLPAVTTDSLCVARAVDFPARPFCPMLVAHAACLCLGVAPLNQAWLPAVRFAKPSGIDNVVAIIYLANFKLLLSIVFVFDKGVGWGKEEETILL